jgi:hypothetical protein
VSDTLTSSNLPAVLSEKTLTFTVFSETVGSSQTRTTIYIGNFQASIILVALGLHTTSSSSPSSGGSTAANSNSNPALASSTSASSAAESTGMVNGTQPVGSSTTVTLANGGTTVVPLSLTTKDAPSTGYSSLSASAGDPSSGLVTSKDGSGSRTAVIIGSVLGGVVVSATMLLLLFFKLRRKRRDVYIAERESEKSHSSDGLQVSDGTNSSIPSDPFIPFSNASNNFEQNSRENRHRSPASANPNLVGAFGSTSSSGLVPATARNRRPPSYVSNAQFPRVDADNSSQPITLPPPMPPATPLVNGSRPIDAVWLLTHAIGSRERDREREIG